MFSTVEPPLQYATEGRHYDSLASYLFSHRLARSTGLGTRERRARCRGGDSSKMVQMRSQMTPTWPLEALRWLQDGTMAPIFAKRPQITPIGPKMVPARHQDAPRRPQDSPTWPQVAPR